MVEILPLFAFIAPFILWPLEQLFPYPHIIEELAKLALIYPLLTHKHSQLKLAILIGIFFAFSESVLYSLNIFATGNLSPLLYRFLFTSSLHSFTTFTMTFFGRKNKLFLFLGLMISILVHYAYNRLIPIF